MKVNGISLYSLNNNYRNISKKETNQNNSNVSFQGRGTTRVSAALLAALLGLSLVGCSRSASASGREETVQVSTLQNVGSGNDLTFSTSDAKIMLADISLMSMPVSELYGVSPAGVTTIKPNKNVERNNNGSVIVTITQNPSDRTDEGSTLGEIINKVYSKELSSYDEEERASVFNKIIDETIQSNPALAAYIEDELGKGADSYSDIANLNLYNPFSNPDSSYDLKLLTMPTEIVYQRQSTDYNKNQSYYTGTTYSPSIETASVITGGKDLKEGQFSSFSGMIYDVYGENLSDEAYRDILYSIVNDPNNASYFEKNLDGMNFNDILNVGNITDTTRTSGNNIQGDFIGLTMPTVVTFRTNASENNPDDGDKDAIIYQISPASVTEGREDRSIRINHNLNQNGTMNAGDVFELQDVLQFYSSPDGNGRFAYVVDGHLVMNKDVNYQEEFSTNILQQVVYANLPVFSAEYEDENGVHPYGVFDVNQGYDVKGKTLEEIIQNSSINIDRMMSYSFVDENGVSKFDFGVELNLPQFNYRMNKGKAQQKPNVPEETEPSKPNPPCDDDSDPDTPVDEPEPTIPEETEPTKPNPPCDDDSAQDIPVEEPEPTIPENTQPPSQEPPCDDDSAQDVPVEEAPPSIPDTSQKEPDAPAQDQAPAQPQQEAPAQPQPQPETPAQQPSNDSSCGDGAYTDEVVDEGLPTI